MANRPNKPKRAKLTKLKRNFPFKKSSPEVRGELEPEDCELVSLQRVLERPSRRVHAVVRGHQRVLDKALLVALTEKVPEGKGSEFKLSQSGIWDLLSVITRSANEKKNEF